MSEVVGRASRDEFDLAGEELETGEPLPDEPAPGRKKIPARAGGFHNRGTARPAADAPRPETGGPPVGQMVLTTAKYLPAASQDDRPGAQAHARGEAAKERRAAVRGVWTGLAMMVGAAIWFAVGLMDGYIYFFAPVLFVAGLVTFFKGDKGG